MSFSSSVKKILGSALALTAFATGLSAVNSTPAEAVIGGVSINQPAAARIVMGSMACTGALITNQWVITAKHCIGGDTGTVSLGNFRWGENHTVSGVVEHPTADLALIRLDKPTGITPIPVNNYNIANGTNGQIIGWGGVYQFQFFSLKGANVTVNRRVTNVATGDDSYDTSSAFLELNVNNARITYGDSGGPLLVGGALAGVASMANEAASPTARGLLAWYIPVAEFLPWISENTGVNFGSPVGSPAPLIDANAVPPSVIGRLPSSGSSGIDSIINNGIGAFSS
ncbi:MAG: trypsin-like serine protease [Corynebacterium sp.]|nr:trypsin-like serine protease [Corynebacterium sp.]